MARRKRHAKKVHHRKHTRKRSMHGIGGMITDSLLTIGGGIIGKYASSFATDQLSKSTMSEKNKSYIAAAIPVAVGLILPKVVKSPMAQHIGTGMLVIGGVQLAQSAGVISGMYNYTPMATVALGPSYQNTRGVVAGLTTRKAAMITG